MHKARGMLELPVLSLRVTRMLYPYRNNGHSSSPTSRSTSGLPPKLPYLLESIRTASQQTYSLSSSIPLTIQVRVVFQEPCPPISIFSKATVFEHNIHSHYSLWDFDFVDVELERNATSSVSTFKTLRIIGKRSPPTATRSTSLLYIPACRMWLNERFSHTAQTMPPPKQDRNTRLTSIPHCTSHPWWDYGREWPAPKWRITRKGL